MRSGFYLKTEQRSDCVDSQVGLQIVVLLLLLLLLLLLVVRTLMVTEKKFILDAFVNLEPVQRSEDGFDMISVSRQSVRVALAAELFQG